MKTGIALSGGTAAVWGHIGALMALEEMGVKIDAVSGTGNGAPVAALYACGYSPEEMAGRLLEISDTFDFSLLGTKRRKYPWTRWFPIRASGLYSLQGFEKKLESLFLKKGAYSLGDTSIPLYIPAVDCETGGILCFVSRLDGFVSNRNCRYTEKGRLHEAVTAAMSTPVIYPPKRIDGARLCDGSLRSPLPVSPVKTLGAQKVLGVNALCFTYPREEGIPQSAWGMFEIMAKDAAAAARGADYTVHLLSGADGAPAKNEIGNWIRRAYREVKEAADEILYTLYIKES